MTQQEAIDFINANLACHLATLDRGRPRVRGMLMYLAERDGIVFHTVTFKALYGQLLADPSVELCFNDLKAGRQLRVEGRAVLVDDPALKREIVESRPFLKGIARGETYEGMAVFRVVDLRMTTWTMATNMVPTSYEPW